MKRSRQRGAVVLVAMLLVAMVAAASSAALWQQWRGVEVQTAERSRTQSAWVLTGALDWARLILREDARTGVVDHDGEPWALPLQEARLSAFLAAQEATGAGAGPQEDADDAFVSGQISDLQSRLNVNNLASVGRIHEPSLRSFTRLFDLLGLPQSQLSLLAENMRRVSDIGPDSERAAAAPVTPQRLEHLLALGLPPDTVALLAPYVTVLPGRTPININTAGPEVIYSAVAGISLADAKHLVAARNAQPYATTAAAAQQLEGVPLLPAAEFSVGSRFFEVRGQLRMRSVTVQERSVVQRDGLEVMVLQRERTGLTDRFAPGFRG